MKRWIILLTLGGLLRFGCGAPPPPSGTPSTAGPVVRMPKSYRFDPPTLRVKVGTTVTWINEDHFTHNVHFLSGADWRSPPLRPGEQASYTFAQPGEYRYQCDFHAQMMKGVVIVSP